MDSSSTSSVDRRAFLNGQWDTRAPEAQGPVEIASILVQALPQRLDAVARNLERLPGTQIYSKDPRGKLVVVLEAAEVGVIGTMLNTISAMPDVLTAALVFHGTDEA